MAVCSDIFLYSFCLLDTAGLIFILIYFIITLSDLECDYLNAQECCAKLNFVSIQNLSISFNNFNTYFKILVECSKVMVSISNTASTIDLRSLVNSSPESSNLCFFSTQVWNMFEKFQ